jgi:hypothetical protein
MDDRRRAPWQAARAPGHALPAEALWLWATGHATPNNTEMRIEGTASAPGDEIMGPAHERIQRTLRALELEALIPPQHSHTRSAALIHHKVRDHLAPLFVQGLQLRVGRRLSIDEWVIYEAFIARGMDPDDYPHYEHPGYVRPSELLPRPCRAPGCGVVYVAAVKSHVCEGCRDA